MVEKGKITGRQLMVLVLIVTIGDSILVLPSLATAFAKQDVWLVAVLSLLLGMMVMLLFASLQKRNPQLTLVQVCDKVFGKWIGGFLALSFMFYLFLSVAVQLREIGDFMTTQILPETPIEAIHILFFVVVIYATRLGLVPIARTAEVFMPLLILMLIFMLIFLIPEIKIDNIFPLFGEGIKPIIRASVPFISFPFLELVPVLMILPQVKNAEKIRRSLLIGILVGGTVLAVITTLCILILGAELTAVNLYPSYLLARKIQVGNFLERIESILALIWFASIFMKCTLYFYSMSLGMVQIFNLRDRRAVILPLAVLALLVSINVSPNVVYINKVLGEIWPMYDLFYGVVVPCVLLLVSYLKSSFNLDH